MIDHARLNELQADFGVEEVAQIVEAFLEEASEAVEALRVGWSDQRARLDRLHFLKGCARTVGAMRLGNECERLEAGSPGPEEFFRIEREFRAAQTAFVGAFGDVFGAFGGLPELRAAG